MRTCRVINEKDLKILQQLFPLEAEADPEPDDAAASLPCEAQPAAANGAASPQSTAVSDLAPALSDATCQDVQSQPKKQQRQRKQQHKQQQQRKHLTHQLMEGKQRLRRKRPASVSADKPTAKRRVSAENPTSLADGASPVISKSAAHQPPTAVEGSKPVTRRAAIAAQRSGPAPGMCLPACGTSAASETAQDGSSTAVPDPSVFRRAAKDLTPFQRDVLSWLGLVTLGPADTIGDGECMYRAISQQLKVVTGQYTAVWAVQHSELAQTDFQQLRQDAAAEISTNESMQQLLIQDADFLLGESNSHSHTVRAQLLKKRLRSKAMSALPAVFAAVVKMTIAKGKPR